MNIAVSSKIEISLPKGSFSKLDGADITFNIPQHCRLGFTTGDGTEIRWNDVPSVGEGIGFVQNSDSFLTMPNEWYKDHTLYFYAEKSDVVLTFQAVPVMGKGS